MSRRAFLFIAGAALAAPRLVAAQGSSRTFRVGILDETEEGSQKETWSAFRNRLRELGYAEGKNLVIDSRYAAGDSDRLPALAAELVALKPDLIACAGTPATRAAIRATTSIPVIFVSSGDPVATGLVASLAKPGRNVTGISSITLDTGQKTLELLVELAPAARRLAYLADPANQVSAAVFSRIEEHARKLKLSIQMLDVSARGVLKDTFETIRRDRVQGLLVGSSGTVIVHGDEIVQFAAREKLPAVYGRIEFASRGALLTYGADRRVNGSRGADLVHRILRGAKPAELPVEQVSAVRMVLNLKTARPLGIRIPDTIRLRADEVID